jgi:peptidoglycan/LPS O-acetylase OafA/YrhL
MFGFYRFVLALFVMAMHVGDIRDIGCYAVFSFFVLSGFLMTTITNNTYGFSGHGITLFLFNRALRIYPPYYASLLIAALCLCFLPAQVELVMPHFRSPADLKEWFQLVMLFYIIPGPFAQSTLQPLAWALTVELFFYALIGLGLTKTFKRTLVMLCLGIGYALLMIAYKSHFYPRYCYIPAALFPFMIGSAVYYVNERLKATDIPLVKHYHTLLILLLSLLYVFNFALADYLDMTRKAFYYINVPISGLLCYLLATYRAGPRVSRWDRELGALSYPIYLMHMPAAIIANLMSGYDRFTWPLFFVAVPIVIILSLLIQYTIEQPMEVYREKIKGWL